MGETLRLVARGKLAKEAVPEVLREVASGLGVGAAIEKLGLAAISRAELLKVVRGALLANKKLVEERRMAAIAPLMGVLMEKVRGRADGKLVHELLERELRKLVKP